MRTDSAIAQLYDRLPNLAPVFVVEIAFDFANTDLHYFVQNATTPTPDAPNTLANCISNLSGTSQRLDTANFQSSIGAYTASLLDVGGAVTALLRSKDQANLSLKNRRLRVYKGRDDMAFADFALIQTQFIDTVDFDGAVYTIKCRDAQRFQKKALFETLTCRLVQDIPVISASASITLTVDSTAGFERVGHGPSYTDNPNIEVGYLSIEDGDNRTLFSWTGKTANTFTGCRLAFSSRSFEYLAHDSANKDRELEIKELVYLELPAIKCAYALLTGNLYNQPGKRLPDHWHVGMDAQYIATSQFTSIGDDLWDIDDDTAGPQVRFIGLENEQGKAFIEKELYGLVNVFSPVLSTGELGLRRLAPVIANSHYQARLGASNVLDAAIVSQYRLDEVRSRILVDWAWDFRADDFKRTDILYDQAGLDKYGNKGEFTLQFKGLATGKHSIADLVKQFLAYYDRFGAPPIRLKLKLLPRMNRLEVGDLVRVDLSHLADFTGSDSLNRTFEIQSIRHNWITGEVEVELFGSTQKFDAFNSFGFTPETGNAVADAFYSKNGTKVSAANYPGAISNSGENATLIDNLTLTGLDRLWQTRSGGYNAGCVYYVLGDLHVPFGRTLTLRKNVFLKVMGHFQVDGDLDCSAGGHAGGYGRYWYTPSPTGGAPQGGYLGEALKGQALTYGFFVTLANNVADRQFFSQRELSMVDDYDVWSGWNLSAPESVAFVEPLLNTFVIPPVWPATPYAAPPSLDFTLAVAETDDRYFAGVYYDLQGSGGAVGGALMGVGLLSTEASWFIDGGAGGSGGAGLLVLCRGMSFGASGGVDLSGGDAPIDAVNGPQQALSWDDLGLDSNTSPYNTTPFPDALVAGVGSGGGPGTLYVVVDGTAGVKPTLNQTTVRAAYGRSDPVGQPVIVSWPDADPLYGGGGHPTAVSLAGIGAVSTAKTGTTPPAEQNKWDVFARAIHLAPYKPSSDANTAAEVDSADFALQALIEYTNTPRSPQGDRSTLEVTVTPPSDPNYSYAQIRYRLAGGQWQNAPAAEPESAFTVPSDGATYTVQARAVSKFGVVSQTGPIQNITVANFAISAATIRAPSVVTGLRIAGQSVSVTEWNTIDLHVACNVDNVLGVPFVLDDWVSHLEFTFKNAATVLHVVETRTPAATLPLNLNDDGADGHYNSITVEVAQVTFDGNKSVPAVRTFTNPAPAAPTGVTHTVGAFGIDFAWTNDAEPDFSITGLFVDTVAGFTPTPTNLKWVGRDENCGIGGLQPSTQYYYKFSSADVYGNTSGYTTELSFTTAATGGAAGSYNDLTDKPTTIADINLAEGAKLLGIEAGATNTTNTNQLADGANLGGTANWSGVANDNGQIPANNASVIGPSLALTRLTNNTLRVHGFSKTGVADQSAAGVVQYHGIRLSLPAATVTLPATFNAARGFLAYSGSNEFGGGNYAFVYRDNSGGWQYMRNGAAAVSFTPTSTMLAIGAGRSTANAIDSVDAWGYAQPLPTLGAFESVDKINSSTAQDMLADGTVLTPKVGDAQIAPAVVYSNVNQVTVVAASSNPIAASLGNATLNIATGSLDAGSRYEAKVSYHINLPTAISQQSTAILETILIVNGVPWSSVEKGIYLNYPTYVLSERLDYSLFTGSLVEGNNTFEMQAKLRAVSGTAFNILAGQRRLKVVGELR